MLEGHNFSPTHVMIEGRPWNAMDCKCGGCTFSEKIRVNDVAGTKASGRDWDHQTFMMVKRRLEKEGWYIGKSARDDRCPKCVAENAAKPKISVGEFLVSSQQLPEIKSVLPQGGAVNGELLRKATPSDNKIIEAELLKVYAGENDGYLLGHTDDTVAKSLGAPKQWVVAVREMWFGTVTTNPEIDRALTEAQRISAATKECLASFDTRRAELAESLRKHDAILRDLEIKYR